METLVKKKNLVADISLLLVALIWGGGFIAAKVALSSITPFYLLSFRFLCSGLLITVIFFSTMKKIDRKTIFPGIILGIFLYTGQTLQTVGLQYTTAGKQSFLVASYTILVPFVSWALIKKKPTANSVLAGLLTLVGIGLLSLQQNLSIGYGDSLTLLFAIIFAFQIVVIGFYVTNYNPIQLTAIQLLIAGSLSLVSALIFEPNISNVNHASFWGILYLIIFNTTIAFLVQNIAQKYTSDTHASIIISLESVFGSLLSVILIGEVFTKKMIIGCVIIFIAVILSKINIESCRLKYIMKLWNYKKKGIL